MNPTKKQQNITQQLQSSGALEQLRNLANQRLGNTATAGVQRTSQPPLQTIPSASQFGKVVNPILPTPVNTQTAQDNLATNVGTFTEGATSNQMAAQEAVAAPTSQKQSVLDKISSLLGVQSTQGERTQDIFEEAGVAEKKALVTKLENEALTKDRAYQKQAEKIRQNAGGALDIGVQSQLNDLDRKRNSELADIAIQAKVAQGMYTDAVAIAEAKVKAEFEPLENQIKTLQNLYQLYQDDLTASEKLQAQAKIQEQQATLDFERDKELFKYKTSIEQQDPLYKLRLEQQRADIAKTNREIAQIDQQGNITPPPLVNPTTGKYDPRGQIAAVINASGAKSSDKAKLSGAVVSVLQQMAENNPDGKFPGIQFGGVGGILRGPKGQNNATYLDSIEGTVESWMTGASVGADQAKRVKNMIPKKGMTPKQIRQHINSLTNYMMGYIAGDLATQGVNYSPESIDFFNKDLISSDEFTEMNNILNQ